MSNSVEGAAGAPQPNPWRGAVAGVAAGLAASLVMDLAQRALQSFSPPKEGEEQSEPSTEQAADRVAQATTGQPLPEEAKPLAGQAVHYAFGASLGLAYGVAAEYWPAVTTGYGSLFGLGNAALFDEAAVPAAGLGPAPWDTPASTHAYAVTSHLIFGAAAEGTRRLVRATL